MINHFNNYRIINHPIEQIVSNNYTVGLPVVDGYVFCGFDNNPPIVTGNFSDDFNSISQEIGIPIGKPVVVARPVFPSWAFDVCVIYGRKI